MTKTLNDQIKELKRVYPEQLADIAKIEQAIQDKTEFFVVDWDDEILRGPIVELEIGEDIGIWGAYIYDKEQGREASDPYSMDMLFTSREKAEAFLGELQAEFTERFKEV